MTNQVEKEQVGTDLKEGTDRKEVCWLTPMCKNRALLWKVIESFHATLTGPLTDLGCVQAFVLSFVSLQIIDCIIIVRESVNERIS